MHGVGCYTWKDGRKYEGDYCMDKKHGHGVYTWADGKRYDGMWENGRQHGEGKYISDDKVKLGIWKEGKRIKWLNDTEEGDDREKGLNE